MPTTSVAAIVLLSVSFLSLIIISIVLRVLFVALDSKREALSDVEQVLDYLYAECVIEVLAA